MQQDNFVKLLVFIIYFNRIWPRCIGMFWLLLKSKTGRKAMLGNAVTLELSAEPVSAKNLE